MLDEMTIREKLPVRIPVFKHIKLKMEAVALGKTLTQHVEDKLDK